MPQQLANLLLPVKRPDIQPSTRETKKIDSQSGGKSNSFERTLDRQLDNQPSSNNSSSVQRNDNTQAVRDTSDKDDVTVSDPDAATSDNAKNTDVSNTDQAAGKTDGSSNEEVAADEVFAINPTLLNIPVGNKLATNKTPLSVNKTPELAGVPVGLLPDALIDQAAKGTTSATGQKPGASAQPTNLFSQELISLNGQFDTKAASEEAKIKTAALSGETKSSKTSGSLLEKVVSEISGAQNAQSNSLSNGAPNAATNANVTINTPATATAEISQAVEELTITPQNAHNVSTKFGTAIQSNQSAQTAVNSLALQIARHVDQGINRFQIRMDPPELGRIDVKLEFRQDGRMTANLTVERPETLDLLQRDAKALERALNGSGLDTDKDSLNFSLKDQSANEFAEFSKENESDSKDSQATDDDIDPDALTTLNLAAYRNLLSSSAVDIRI